MKGRKATILVRSHWQRGITKLSGSFLGEKLGIQLLLGYKDLVKRWTTKPDTAERHVREIKTGFLARNLLLFNYSHYLFQMFSNEAAGDLDLESSL